MTLPLAPVTGVGGVAVPPGVPEAPPGVDADAAGVEGDASFSLSSLSQAMPNASATNMTATIDQCRKRNAYLHT